MTALPSSLHQPPDNDGPSRPKKRRLPKACEACRKSKRSCDQRRPCSQCVKSQIDCVVVDGPKDPLIERIERAEESISTINRQLQGRNARVSQAGRHDTRQMSMEVIPSPTTTHSTSSMESTAALQPPPPRSYVPTSTDSFIIREASVQDVVSSGLISEYDAQIWFAAFFQGSDRFVPVFDPRNDTFASVRGRNHFLFDVLILYGCRSVCGALSRIFKELYPAVRRITSDLVLLMTNTDRRQALAVEHIQAMLVLASYSDNGGVLCDIVVRAAVDMGLTAKLDKLFASLARTRYTVEAPELGNRLSDYVAARVWYAIFVLDQILSLDGGKPPTVTLPSISCAHRVRALLSHPDRAPLDIRLFAQVELNTIRRAAYDSLSHLSCLPPTGDPLALDSLIAKIINNTLVDLGLWLSEWTAVIPLQNHSRAEDSLTLLNLRIQHSWATLALHLHGLTAHGIENIALMTDSQREIAHAAKTAAEGHLDLLLTPVSSAGNNGMSYAPTLQHASSFARAKTAFSILIVLRLGILLDDGAEEMQGRLRKVKEFLRKLDEARGSHGENGGERDRKTADEEEEYTRILRQSVLMCERAIWKRRRTVGSIGMNGGGEIEGTSSQGSRGPGVTTVEGAGEGRESEGPAGDFQHFVPKEFTIEWSFPGLNLCYVPVDWRDLLWDFGGGS